MSTVFCQIQVMIILPGLRPGDPAVTMGIRMAASRLSTKQASRTDLNMYLFISVNERCSCTTVTLRCNCSSYSLARHFQGGYISFSEDSIQLHKDVARLTYC